MNCDCVVKLSVATWPYPDIQNPSYVRVLRFSCRDFCWFNSKLGNGTMLNVEDVTDRSGGEKNKWS